MIALLIGTVVVLHGPIQGMLSSPWSAFWFSKAARTGEQLAGNPESLVSIAPDPADLNFGHGRVSDAQRYQLARFVGWNREDAITATAISIAENGSGDPAALSGLNWNNTRDLGLWQINTIHWTGCGGAQALTDPLTNARCAYGVFGASRNWCAWSTYGPCSSHACGPPCFSSFLARARTAADTPIPAGQA